MKLGGNLRKEVKKMTGLKVFRKTARRSISLWAITYLPLVLILCEISWAQGDNLWNFRQNADDRFHSNEAWLRPWRYEYEDGWGRWVGNYGYHILWGATSMIGNVDGSFSISRSRDYQFHAWTYVYVESAKTITFTGSGDCVPRVFLNYAFDSPRTFPATLTLNSGWNRIDITGYNQNNSYVFNCGALDALVDVMNSSEIPEEPPDADSLWNFRQNADDRFHSNEAWVRPWRYNYEDGWGRWVGNYGYHIQWGATNMIGNVDGSFSISRSRDHQFHAWTYVYVESAKTITFTGSGDCVPRVFLNYAFDSPRTFPATMTLNSGWNRIDITGYNQNNSYVFTCGPLATLVDIMNSSEISNRPPEADAGGPYPGNEGQPIVFDASGSNDPDGDSLSYRWDFENDGTWDTAWSSSPTALRTWPDDWVGIAKVEVSDGEFNISATAAVTVSNVVPSVAIDDVGQPNPCFILPNQIITFSGSFSDQGWLDTHTYTWTFDDGSTAQGIPIEENNPPDATGTTVVDHVYVQSGAYNVTLRIIDDNGGYGVSTAWIVNVLAPLEIVQPLNDYIQSRPDSAFDKQPDRRKRNLGRSLDTIADFIAIGDYAEAMRRLDRDIRSRADGSTGGNLNNDWIIDPVAQQDIGAMIDELIACLS